jgi:hypothetical protein
LAKVNVPINKKRKVGPKTVDCVFLGYAIHSVGYRFLIINSIVHDMVVGTIMKYRDTIFFENKFFMKNTPRTCSHDSIFLPETQEPVIHVDVKIHKEIPEEDNNIVARKIKRRRVAKSFDDDYIIYLVDDTPTTIAESYLSLDIDLWKEAV